MPIQRRVPPSPEASDLYDELYKLYLQAGEPAVRTLAKECGRGPNAISHNTIHRVLTEPHQTKLPHLKVIVVQLSTRAHGDNSHEASDVQRFTQMWMDAKLAEQRVSHDGDGLHHDTAVPGATVTAGHRTLQRTKQDTDRGLQDRLADVARQRDELQQDQDAAVQKLTELRQERDKLRQELAAAVQERNAVIQERDELQQKLVDAVRERDAAMQECDELQKGKLDTKRRWHLKMPTLPVGRY